MEKIIKAAVDRGASDLHIKAGDVFRARIDGKLVPLTKQRLTPDQTRAIALQLIPSEEDRGRVPRDQPDEGEGQRAHDEPRRQQQEQPPGDVARHEPGARDRSAAHLDTFQNRRRK